MNQNLDSRVPNRKRSDEPVGFERATELVNEQVSLGVRVQLSDCRVWFLEDSPTTMPTGVLAALIKTGNLSSRLPESNPLGLPASTIRQGQKRLGKTGEKGVIARTK